MGSVLVIILSTSELLQMKRQLVLTTVGLRHQRREHILILHSVSFSQDFEPMIIRTDPVIYIHLQRLEPLLQGEKATGER